MLSSSHCFSFEKIPLPHVCSVADLVESKTRAENFRASQGNGRRFESSSAHQERGAARRRIRLRIYVLPVDYKARPGQGTTRTRHDQRGRRPRGRRRPSAAGLQVAGCDSGERHRVFWRCHNARYRTVRYGGTLTQTLATWLLRTHLRENVKRLERPGIGLDTHTRIHIWRGAVRF